MKFRHCQHHISSFLSMVPLFPFTSMPVFMLNLIILWWLPTKSQILMNISCQKKSNSLPQIFTLTTQNRYMTPNRTIILGFRSKSNHNFRRIRSKIWGKMGNEQTRAWELTWSCYRWLQKPCMDRSRVWVFFHFEIWISRWLLAWEELLKEVSHEMLLFLYFLSLIISSPRRYLKINR